MDQAQTPPKTRQIFKILLIKQQNRSRLISLRPGSAGMRLIFQSLGSLEETMIPRLIPRRVLAAIAGAAIALAVSSSPSFAFTLSSPSVTEPVIKAGVQQVYYYRRHYYRPYYHHYYRPYYRHYYHPYYYHHYYHHYYRPYYYHHYYRPYYYHPYYYHPYYHHYYYHTYY
jgi:hypothetical protein